MWIRSQNEDVLVDCKGFYIHTISENLQDDKGNRKVVKFYSIKGVNNNYEVVLGRYNSLEECKKVMDNLQEVVWENITDYNYIYHMPKEVE